MKKEMLWPFIIFALLLGGCATNTAVTEQIQKKAMEQGSVFEELKTGTPGAGFGVLIIRATMKTVKEGFYPLESKTALHGKSEYPFVFNIGGQGVVWMAKGTADIQPRQIDNHRNPEGGDGVKYTLEKKISLKTGSYRIYVGLAEEKLQKTVDIDLAAGSASILEFKPVYGRDKGWGPRFYKGVRDFEIFLDGKEIEPNITR
jgi:hypothetical protein